MVKANTYIIILTHVLILHALLFNLPAASSDILNKFSKASASTTSIACGTVIGTPIAIVRKTSSQYVGCVSQFKKDSNTYKFWGAAYSAPVAVGAGLIKGTVYGAKNAVHYSINNPFGKDAFSLGKLETNDPAKAAKNDLKQNFDKPESQPWGTR